MSHTYMDGKPMMALNAMQSITIHGLATRDDGTPTKLEIKRTAPDSSKKKFFPLLFNGSRDTTVIPEIPPPTQSRLPPDGDVMLELQLGDVLGQNDRNVVYAVRVTNADSVACYVPPLVMKVARLFKGRNVSEEAGMYQDLECLQGSIIPRCFWYFCATIDHTQVAILPWDGPDCEYPRKLDPHIPFSLPHL
ncbi:hypothetical protein L226DRAFT_570280 [Lentinus tigrinus ALCF2SS1-7]|uniref:Uncharacterized protein n=1 Tax=Lentinus tigrinus ALCF2SS1-6 TaxID=1328759 RepID=A0A5C2SEK4_9APHY|nr:hypothetical protein L227DRAFT_610139 [Lentinus tigrinus ALCF2SS1-6]RPD76072.1 hypothetical protein L226DRAFT_570280 [Lentinus tigrinus ALCF2SS1-7]